MTIPEASKLGSAGGLTYAVGVTRVAQATARQEGQAAVALIEGSAVPPPGLQGQGTHVNLRA